MLRRACRCCVLPRLQVAWLYGAMLFNCVPRSSTLRAAVACCCWALLGYIAHEMVAFSVKAASPGAPAG